MSSHLDMLKKQDGYSRHCLGIFNSFKLSALPDELNCFLRGGAFSGYRPYAAEVPHKYLNQLVLLILS